MDCFAHGLNTNRTTGNWHQAGCNGSCVLQKWHWQVWLVSTKYRQKWHWQKMVCKYQIQAKMTLVGMVGKYQTQANSHRPGTGTVVRGNQYGAIPRRHRLVRGCKGDMGAKRYYCWDCTGMFTGTLAAGTLPINCFFRCSVHHMNRQPDN